MIAKELFFYRFSIIYQKLYFQLKKFEKQDKLIENSLFYLKVYKKENCYL